MTTGISLVRENVVSMQPPRSLWVTFPLGRPLGVPNDAAFQHRVIAAGLALLEQDHGPVLQDYPEDAPAAGDSTSYACPVSFAQQHDQDTWHGRLLAEFTSLQPWYGLGLRRRGDRTLVGLSDLTVEQNLAKLGEYLDKNEIPATELGWFKGAIEDAKAFYLEALTAQPGDYDQADIYQILWRDTQLGAGLKQFYERFSAHPQLSAFARIILPRQAVADSPDADVVADQPESS